LHLSEEGRGAFDIVEVAIGMELESFAAVCFLDSGEDCVSGLQQ
jgi:hypothetical protein